MSSVPISGNEDTLAFRNMRGMPREDDGPYQGGRRLLVGQGDAAQNSESVRTEEFVRKDRKGDGGATTTSAALATETKGGEGGGRSGYTYSRRAATGCPGVKEGLEALTGDQNWPEFKPEADAVDEDKGTPPERVVTTGPTKMEETPEDYLRKERKDTVITFPVSQLKVLKPDSLGQLRLATVEVSDGSEVSLVASRK